MGQSPKSSNNKQFTIKDTIKYRKYYKTFVIGSGAFLIAFLISSMFAPVQNSDAAQLFNVENSRTGYYVNVSGSATIDVSVDATPEGQLVGAVDTITTTTNSPRGYQLYISASPNYLYLNGDSSTASQGKFSPIGGDLTSAATLGRNTWGFAYNKTNTGVAANNFGSPNLYTSETSPIVPDATATYASLPTTDTKIQEINASNYPSGTELNVYYGLKASTDLPSGTYSGSITYTAISEGVNTNADTMQDFTTEACQALPTATKDNYETAKKELIDVRDGKWYTVAKMADGNCWMTSNLALDGTDSSGAVRTLTPDDSNVSENRTLAANISGTVEAKYDEIQINSSVANQTTTTKNYDYAVVSDVKYGNLYNWNAATAGVGKQATAGTVYESICPKGWRLPDNGAEGVDKSWGNLTAKVIGGDGTSTVNGVYVQNAQGAPLRMSLAGFSNGGSLHNQARLAYFWSRTGISSDANNALTLRLNSEDGSFRPQDGYGKTNGFSVRCVFQGSTIENNMHIQDVTTTMCNNLNESTTTSDNRRTVIDGRDGKSYQISHLADGNCWMVSNLALDGARDLFPGSSNVTEKRTLPVNMPDGTDSEYDIAQIYSKYATTQDDNGNYYGNFYNWNAATGTVGKYTTTSKVTESVCPTQWRLPSATGDKSWYQLMTAYGFPDHVDTHLGDLSVVDALKVSPFHMSYPGAYIKGHDSVFSGWTGVGYNSPWTNTPVDENGAIMLNANQWGGFDKNQSNAKFVGYPVRCVLGS